MVFEKNGSRALGCWNYLYAYSLYSLFTQYGSWLGREEIMKGQGFRKFTFILESSELHSYLNCHNSIIFQSRNMKIDMEAHLDIPWMGVEMGGWPQSAFTSFWAYFEDGSQHHTKKSNWQSAFTIVNLATKVSIHTKNSVDSQHTKKIEPPNSAYFESSCNGSGN